MVGQKIKYIDAEYINHDRINGSLDKGKGDTTTSAHKRMSTTQNKCASSQPKPCSQDKTIQKLNQAFEKEIPR